MIRRSALVSVVLVLALGTVPSHAFAAGYQNRSTAAPLGAVRAMVLPFTSAAYNHNACNPGEGKLGACPVTRRLWRQSQRELAWERRRPGGNGNMFCRCQNPPRRVTIGRPALSGRVAHVNTRWSWGAPLTVNLTYTVLRQAGGWQVDDEYCTGRPRTSVYHIPVRPCR